jgi:hypothetical protein
MTSNQTNLQLSHAVASARALKRTLSELKIPTVPDEPAWAATMTEHEREEFRKFRVELIDARAKLAKVSQQAENSASLLEDAGMRVQKVSVVYFSAVSCELILLVVVLGI